LVTIITILSKKLGILFYYSVFRQGTRSILGFSL
jgi:hypothetical protein